MSKGFLTFVPDQLKVEIEREESVLDLALSNKIAIDHSCGGQGSCGTCLVHVVQGHELLPQRNELELQLQCDRGLKENERQSCQIPALPNLVIQTKK